MSNEIPRVKGNGTCSFCIEPLVKFLSICHDIHVGEVKHGVRNEVCWEASDYLPLVREYLLYSYLRQFEKRLTNNR